MIAFLSRNYTLLLFFLVAIISGSCKEEPETPKATLLITVFNELGQQQDSVDCLISSSSGNLSGTTNDSGKLEIKSVAIGTCEITFSKQHYITGTVQVSVNADPTEIELVLSSGDSFINLSDTILYVSHQGSTKTVRVESNTHWTTESNAAWLKTSSDVGPAQSSARLVWEKSDEDNDRTAVVYFKAGSLTKKIRVVQTAPVKIIKAEGIIGNYENGVSDSIKIVFNKTITLNALNVNNTYCLPEQLRTKVTDNRIHFNYTCARLGGDYSFTISVKDADEVYTFTFSVPFYTHKITLTGEIPDYFITDDNKFIWANTGIGILKISIPTLAIETSLSPQTPTTHIKWNYYRNTINIFNNATCSFYDIVDQKCDANYLNYINPNTNEITRSRIDLIPGYDPMDFSYAYVFPRDLCLFSDGTGIILLENEDHYTKWRFFNSANSDENYVTDLHKTFSEIRYQQIMMNYDRTKIYLMHPWGSTDIDIYEYGNATFKTFHSPISGRSSVIVPNKKTDRVYIGQLYQQFISDMNSYTSNLSYNDTRMFYGGVDFSYKEGEDETMIYVNDGTMMLLDYKNAFTPFSTDTDSRLSKIHTTTDGRYFFGTIYESDGSTSLFLFDVESTTQNRISSTDSQGKIPTSSRSMPSKWIKGH